MLQQDTVADAPRYSEWTPGSPSLSRPSSSSSFTDDGGGGRGDAQPIPPEHGEDAVTCGEGLEGLASWLPH